MAQTEYVKRQLVRAGFELNESEFTPGSWWGEKSNRAVSVIVEFYTDGAKVHYLNVRRANDISDSQTDYFAGHYVDNVKQAIESAESTLASSLAQAERHEAGECGIANGWKCPICWREERAAGIVDLRSHVYANLPPANAVRII